MTSIKKAHMHCMWALTSIYIMYILKNYSFEVYIHPYIYIYIYMDICTQNVFFKIYIILNIYFQLYHIMFNYKKIIK